jgi:hypothetical protein
MRLNENCLRKKSFLNSVHLIITIRIGGAHGGSLSLGVKNNDVVGFGNLIESKLGDVVSADVSESLLASVELDGEFACS